MERFQKNWSFSTENGKENRESYLWIVLHCARYVHLLFAVIANGVKQSQGIATPAFGKLAMTEKETRNTRYEQRDTRMVIERNRPEVFYPSFPTISPLNSFRIFSLFLIKSVKLLSFVISN